MPRATSAGAVIDYGKAIQASRINAVPHWMRGTVRAELGDLNGALADFEGGLALDPGNAALAFLRNQTRLRLWEAHSRALRAEGDLAGAIAEYDAAIAAGAASAALYYLRGTARAELGDHKGALADFEGGLALDPGNAALEILRSQERLKLAAAAFQAADPDLARALARYDAAIGCFGQNPALHYLRGTVRAELGDLDGAIADFKAGLALDPGDAALRFSHEQTHLQLHQAHARTLRAGGDLAGALAHYDEAIRASRPSASLLYLRGTTLMELGDNRAALADFAAGLALDPENPTLMFLCDLMRARLAPPPPLPIRSLRRAAALARRGMRLVDRSLGLAFGMGARVRPWHWRWPYVHEVVRPLVRALATAPGDVLLVENDELPLAGLLADLPAGPVLTVWSAAELHAFAAERERCAERPERFDRVVCRSPLADRHWPESVAALGQVLRPSGELLLAIPGEDEAAAEEILGERLPEFRFVEARPQGSLGTAVVTRFCNGLRRASWMRRAQNRTGTLGRAILAPPIVLLYPVASLLAALLNLVGRPGHVSLEALLVLRKPPVAVLSHEGAARGGTPSPAWDTDSPPVFSNPRRALHGG